MDKAKRHKVVVPIYYELRLSELHLTNEFIDEFMSPKEIKAVAKEIVKELGYYVKLADWNKKEYLRAKIKVALKNALIRVIDARITYEEVDKIASEILIHAERIHI